MNDQLIADIAKAVKRTPLNQELSPGSTKRRWEPEGGIRKHNEKIHRESKFADEHKNLPFTFSKPKKPTGRSIVLKCINCGYMFSGTTNTVMIVCPECKKASKVEEVEI